MNRRRGARAAWRRASMSLWLWPSVAVAFAYGAGLVLGARPWGGSLFAEPLFRGGASGGRAVLTALVGGLVTALSVIFSLTITGLQLVHQQYSPRLLRNFVRDRATKVTLGVFAGTVAYMLAVLRAIPPGDSPDPVPRLAIFVGMFLFLACVGIVAYFAQHITNAIRVHRAMDRVAADTRGAIERERDADGGMDRVAIRAPLPQLGDGAVPVPAWQSGYVTEIDAPRLARGAEAQGVSIRLGPMIGDHVVAGAPIAWVRAPDGGPAPDMVRDLRGSVELGRDRSEDTDIAYGLRQLVDVAVRAMSPSLNDPYTAMQAIDHMTVLLARLAQEGVPNGVIRAADGKLLVAVPGLDLADHLRLATAQTRRYGAQDTAVAVRLLKLLHDLATVAPPEAREVIEAEVDRVLSAAEDQAADQDDLSGVRAEAETARAALRGAPRPRAASYVRL